MTVLIRVAAALLAASISTGGAFAEAPLKIFDAHLHTWINERWLSYDAIFAEYRGWLAQLPDEQARRIAYRNAERLFGGKIE